MVSSWCAATENIPGSKVALLLLKIIDLVLLLVALKVFDWSVTLGCSILWESLFNSGASCSRWCCTQVLRNDPLQASLTMAAQDYSFGTFIGCFKGCSKAVLPWVTKYSLKDGFIVVHLAVVVYSAEGLGKSFRTILEAKKLSHGCSRLSIWYLRWLL